MRPHFRAVYFQCIFSILFSFQHMVIISWQPALVIKHSLWKTTSPLAPYLGSSLRKPLHYSEPVGHLMNLISNWWHCTSRRPGSLQSLQGVLLATRSQGHCWLLQELGSFLSKLKQNVSPSFLALAASTHIALSTRGTILVFPCTSGPRLEGEMEGTGSLYLMDSSSGIWKSFHTKQPSHPSSRFWLICTVCDSSRISPGRSLVAKTDRSFLLWHSRDWCCNFYNPQG